MVEPHGLAVIGAGMGGMADFLAHSMVDNSCFVSDLAFVFFLTLGLLQQITRPAEQTSA